VRLSGLPVSGLSAAANRRIIRSHDPRALLPVVKSLLRAVTPPVAVSAARRLGLIDTPGLNCDGIYPSYEAAADAGKEYSDDDALLEIVKAKARLLKAVLAQRPIPELQLGTRIAETVGLILGKVDSPRVIDFGGALGTAYHAARAIAPGKFKSWSVVELKEIRQAGREFEDGVLRFSPSFDLPADLVFTDGCLQFVSSPLETLDRLGHVGAPFLCVRRMVLTKGKTFWTVLRSTRRRHSPEDVWDDSLVDGPVALPMAVVNRREFEGVLEEQYEITLRLREPKGVYRAKDWTADMFGYFCERR
jgi:putative methyltransferase (TIGR04325 family)